VRQSQRLNLNDDLWTRRMTTPPTCHFYKCASFTSIFVNQPNKETWSKFIRHPRLLAQPVSPMRFGKLSSPGNCKWRSELRWVFQFAPGFRFIFSNSVCRSDVFIVQVMSSPLITRRSDESNFLLRFFFLGGGSACEAVLVLEFTLLNLQKFISKALLYIDRILAASRLLRSLMQCFVSRCPSWRPPAPRLTPEYQVGRSWQQLRFNVEACLTLLLPTTGISITHGPHPLTAWLLPLRRFSGANIIIFLVLPHSNKCIGDDTKSAARRSPNYIRKTTNVFCGTLVSNCPVAEILRKSASPRKKFTEIGQSAAD